MAGKAARRAAAPPARPAASAAPRDTQRLDRLIHDRVRLGILSALSAVVLICAAGTLLIGVAPQPFVEVLKYCVLPR